MKTMNTWISLSIMLTVFQMESFSSLFFSSIVVVILILLSLMIVSILSDSVRCVSSAILFVTMD